MSTPTIPEYFEAEEIEALQELMAMKREELDKVPFEVVKWQCKVKFCKCYTRVRDYGCHPIYYGPRMATDKWFNVYENFFICSKHWPRYKNRPSEDIPLKKHKSGHVVVGIDETTTPKILY